MNKNTMLIGIVVLLVLVGGWFFLQNNAQPTSEPVVITGADSTESGEALTDDKVMTEKNTIIFDNSGFSPSTLTISAGESVRFVNNSDRAVWPASAVHPTHTAYPTTGGCIGSAFDACRGIVTGEDWSFVFDEVGSWKYHNHLSPRTTGTIIVE